MGTGMTVFLAFLAVIGGLVGILTLAFGSSIVGLIWWILALLSLVSIPVLNFLKRIAIATEKRGAASAGDNQPAAPKAYRDPDFSKNA